MRPNPRAVVALLLALCAAVPLVPGVEGFVPQGSVAFTGRSHARDGATREFVKGATDPAAESVTADADADADADAAENPKLKKEQFANDGIFSWMTPYMDVFGFKEGNTMVGAIPTSIDRTVTGAVLDPSVIDERRRVAARDLVNIGLEERSRRTEIGNVGLKVAAVYAVFATLFLDQGDLGGHLARFTVLLPFLFGYAFRESGKEGL